MRKLVLLLFITMFYSVSYGQFPASVDSVYTFIKYNSILRTTVDWTQIDKTFNEQIKTAKSLRDTMECFVTILGTLNDVHSQIFLNNKYFGHYPTFNDTTLSWLKPINDKAVSLTNQIHTKIIVGKIGYVRVPAFQVYGSKQINGFAQSLADSIIELSQKAKKGFIIDLRLNGGGNIYPMLSGLSSFLGNQTVGYETNVNDSITRTWEIKNGNFVIGGYQSTNILVKPIKKFTSIPIVILIGPITKSAGSMTAIAFKGRPNTVFIGEPTADGYTTSNGYFQVSPNLTLNFATNYVSDRNMKIYKTMVRPDILVYKGDNFDKLTEDKKMQAAIKWLMEK
jgi:hypothetical protein